MKDETEQMVAPGFYAEELIFDDHVYQENGTVIDVVFRDEQPLVEHLDDVSGIVVKSSMVNHEKHVIERGETEEDDFEIQ